MKSLKIVFASAISLASLFSGSAFADTVGNLAVSATVVKGGCGITVPEGVNFDTITPSSDDLNSTGTVQVKCDAAGVDFTVALDVGQHKTLGTRQMVGPDGKSVIAYQLFKDKDHSDKWGNGTAFTGDPLTAKSNGTAQKFTVFATVSSPKATDAEGKYSDTVVASLMY